VSSYTLSLATPTYTVAQIAEHFKLNTVLWTFHTIQPSSLENCNFDTYIVISCKQFEIGS